MCPGRRAFGSCLVVAPGYVAHSHHNPGAAVPAAPVAGVVGVVGARGGCQLVRALLSCAVAASSCPVAAFGLVVWGGITTIGVRHAGDTPSRGFYGSKTPRCAAGLCGGLSVLCSTCSPSRPDAPKKGCLGRSGRGFAMLGVCHRASSAWSASSVRGVAAS